MVDRISDYTEEECSWFDRGQRIQERRAEGMTAQNTAVVTKT